MAKSNQTGRTRANPFVMLTYNVIDSPAWRSLSSHAQALWLHIKRRYNSFNNGEISLSVREGAALLNVSKDTAKKAFDELREKGFIKIGIDSTFNQKLKKARRWIITSEVHQETSPTNEWKNWKK